MARRFFHALEHRLTRRLRGVRTRLAGPLIVEEIEMTSLAGYRLFGHVHRTESDSLQPGIVLCPGSDRPGSVFDDETTPLTADEVVGLGCVVLHFDPAGRGESWGAEDYGGPEHQDDVVTAVKVLRSHPQVDPTRVGLVAISLGLAMATGAAATLADAGEPVAWLLDWEGPSDRDIITAGGTMNAPTLGHALDDDRYWHPREAHRHVGRIDCAYVRLQARHDHAQPGELRHAHQMIEAAAAASLPWFQLNDHAPGRPPPEPRWLSSGPLAANQAILRHIAALNRSR